MRFLLAHGERPESIPSSIGLEGAAYFGHWRLCEFLLENGADVNGSNPDTGETPLHGALCAPNRPAFDLVVRVLLAAGADPKRQDQAGRGDRGPHAGLGVDASVRSYSPSGDQGSMATHSGYGVMWWIQINAAAHPELRIPNGSFTASGLGGQLMTVIPEIETVIVNLMHTDEPGPRLGTVQWDRLLGIVLAARLP